MSVVVEFTVPAEGFTLGRIVTDYEDVRVRLERIIPTGGEVVPFFWTETGDGGFGAFERGVRTHPLVKRLQVLDRLENERLYGAEWETEPKGILEAIVRSNGTILSGRGGSDEWEFTIRVPDHADLASFQEHLTGHDVPIRIDRISPFSASERGGYPFDITGMQREALVRAVAGGYFEVPRGVDLTDVAEELGITRQAASERVRRGANTVLRTVLFDG